MQMSLTSYRALGRSGLLVSPLALGTMTFGTARWGSSGEQSREVFDAYVEAGGNFVDTADVYAGGRSEELLGSFIAERGWRDRLVVATKAGFAAGPGPNAGGNGAKHLHAALNGSLRRLQTDYVDLFWIHVWDSVTPAEELLESMTAIVRSGKVRYWGISNAPAWYVAKVAALATRDGAAPIALQYFYSLVNRDIEDEHVPLATDSGLGLVPWSPLAYGLLTGKYDRAAVESGASRQGGLPNSASSAGEMRPAEDNRLDGPNPFGDTLFTDRNWRIVDAVRRVAAEAGQPPALIALAWVIGQPGITSTLIGASRAAQVVENARALLVQFSPEQSAQLDAISARDARMLYTLFAPALREKVIFGGSSVKPWR
ncbi:MAG: aldo/keto reductase [Vicinamibacterales bacterium]